MANHGWMDGWMGGWIDRSIGKETKTKRAPIRCLRRCHRRRSVGGTHFTVLATLEVVGKAVPGLVSGLIAERIGYFGLFALGVVLTAAVQMLLYPLSGGAAPKRHMHKSKQAE